jgi:hypothetical protein
LLLVVAVLMWGVAIEQVWMELYVPENSEGSRIVVMPCDNRTNHPHHYCGRMPAGAP